MPTVYTQPGTYIAKTKIDATVFDRSNDNKVLRFDGSSYLPPGIVSGITIDVVQPFNNGQVRLGHGSSGVEESSIADFADVRSGEVGTRELQGWRDFFNALRRTDNPRIFAHFDGTAEPTEGEINLYVTMLYD